MLDSRPGDTGRKGGKRRIRRAGEREYGGTRAQGGRIGIHLGGCGRVSRQSA
jgi:hypothetical protein